MSKGGKLIIEASNSYLDEAYCRTHDDVEPGQYLLIAVSDTGSGMSKEVLERAFEPFYTTKVPGQGTGLGLSQVYGFVRQSGGHIILYSEPGQGTTAKMYLRRFYGEAPAPRKGRSAAPRGNRGECILLVEDDSDVINHIAETLSSLGYEVLEADDSSAALRIVDADRTIALLLTDVVLPRMNGRELADEVRKRNSAIKVLYMTGYSRNAVVHHGRLDQGADLMQKPIASAQLAAMVRKVLDA